MDVAYELSREEYEYLNRRSLRERQGKAFAILYLVLWVGVFLPNFMRYGFLSGLVAVLMGTAGYALLLFVLMRVLFRVTFNALKKSPSWGKTTIHLEPEALIAATYLVKTEIRWEAVEKISDDPRGFYLQLNPLQIIMVPRRVFAAAEEAQAFWVLAQQYFQHARHATVAAERARLST